MFRRISLIREVLWALIQTVASDIEFDYQEYADRNLRAYRIMAADRDDTSLME